MPTLWHADSFSSNELQFWWFNWVAARGLVVTRGPNPHERLRIAVEKWCDGGLPGPLPTRWERFADVAILPATAFTAPTWSPDDELWAAVAKALDVKRLGRMGEVSGPRRESGVELLLGEDDLVVRREHGIDFGYPFTRCMWSAGNVTERGRIADADHTGERILDLFAGIGYYTLPFLTAGAQQHGAGADHVVACEWNPIAANALVWSLEENGLTERCTVLEGDNRQHVFDRAFDRVNLGLLPSSEEGWNQALSALKESGGILHVHALAPGGEEREEAERICTELGSTGPFSCEIQHIEIVKWYAPHQRHIVVDVHAQPVSH
jgi:tRNA wybutosine-synthesizing protein 3